MIFTSPHSRAEAECPGGVLVAIRWNPVTMFERFTERAHDVVVYAEQEARELGT
jgi:hypothetical protein